MFCHRCGKENEDGVKYCGFCGMSLIDPAADASRSDGRIAADAPAPDPAPAGNKPQKTGKKKWPVLIIVIIAIVVIAVTAAAFFLTGSSAKNSYQTQYELGEQYLEEADYEQAVVAFTAAIEIEPEETDAYLGRAEAYIGLNDDESLEAALTDCRTVIDLDGTKTQAYISASEVYIIREEYEEAQSVLEEGLARNPEDEDLADALEEAEDLIEEAELTGRYQAYSEKLTQLQETYGEAKLERMDETVTFDMGDGYQLYTYYWTGLFFAHLVDMDGDGTQELITGYYDPEKADTSSGYSLLTTGYTIDIWIYADGDLQGYSVSPSQMGWSAEEGYIECEIGLTDDAAYVISSDVSGELTRYEYYGLTDGTVEQIHSFDASSDPIIVDGLEYGDEDAYEETTAMVLEWQAGLTDSQYWYFGGQYVLQEDISCFEAEYKAEMAPAEEELESTLAALAAYLSTSSEEGEDETQTQGDRNIQEDLTALPSPEIISASATSELVEDDVTHSASRAIDGDLTKAWVEGASGQGIGESITLTLSAESALSGITIYAGYQKSQDLYLKNSRPQRITLDFSDGTQMTLTLEDVCDAQTFSFDETIAADSVTVTIDSVYEGTKYEDTVISEIMLF